MSGQPLDPANVPSLLLLDCEVIALSMRADRLWPSVTPTIDRGDERSVTEAIDRGISSLLVRGLVTPGVETPAPEVLEATEPVLEGDPVLAVFVGSSKLEIDTGFSATACYELGTISVEETVTPDGIHYLRVFDAAAYDLKTAAFVDSLLELGMNQLVGPSAPDRRLWFLGPPSPEAVRTVMVQGSEVLHGFTSAQTGIFESQGELASGSAAVKFLRNVERASV